MTAAIGDNSKLTEDERAALYGHLCREERDQLVAAASVEAKRKENFKRGKEWGFSKEEISFHEKARKAGAGSPLISKFDIQKRVLIKIGLIPDDRGADLLGDRADRLQMITARGEADGLVGEGGAGASGYSGGSDEDIAYMDGWRTGQAKYANNWKLAMEKKLAERSKEEPASDGDPFADAAE